MTTPDEAGNAPDTPATRVTASSTQLQLELAVLAAELDAARPAGQPDDTASRAVIVLVVAAEPDQRAYIADCLRNRADLRPLDAATVGAALDLAGRHAPRLLIVDVAGIEIVRLLPDLPAIVIVDEVSDERRRLTRGGGARVLLARPFNARALLEQLDWLLRDT